jgi:hypothetical protein
MSNHIYDTTLFGVMEWAKSELDHVGRIVSIKDKALQYSYALSTVNGMAHLRDALFQMVNDPVYAHRRQDLLTTHDAVIRTMNHLIRDFNIDLRTIRAFNTPHVLSPFTYLRKSRKNRKSRKTLKTLKNLK